MTDKNDLIRSVDDIIVNMNDLRNDVEDLDDHDHDRFGCSECEDMFDTGVEEGKESHEHDTWSCVDCQEVANDGVREAFDNLSVTDLMDSAWDVYEKVLQDGKEEGAEEERDTQRQKLAAFSTMLYNLADFVKKWDDFTVATFEHNALAIRNVLHPERQEQNKVEGDTSGTEVAY